MAGKYATKIAACWLTALSISGLVPVALAENQTASREAKVMVCVACHGADGIGKSTQYPNLRGQKIGYLEKQLRDFRSGARKAPHMERMARPLSDEDIVDMTRFFADLNPDISK